MNIRQQKYKKNRLEGMNMYNAAIAAGYSHNTAIKACEKLEPKMSSLKDCLDQQGLTDKKLAIYLTEVVEANKVVGYLHQYKKGEKGRIEELGPDEAISNEFLEIPDWNIRLKAIELVAKIKGVLETNKILIDQSKKEITQFIMFGKVGDTKEKDADTTPSISREHTPLAT